MMRVVCKGRLSEPHEPTDVWPQPRPGDEFVGALYRCPVCHYDVHLDELTVDLHHLGAADQSGPHMSSPDQPVVEQLTTPALRCSTCGQEIEPKADPPPNRDDEPLLSGHCRFCRLAADYARFLEARTHRGGQHFELWQLVLLSGWLRLKAHGESTK